MFGVNRVESNIGVIGFGHRDQIRTILSLLDLVPKELITPPFSMLMEFLQCRSTLMSALSIWDVGDIQRKVTPVNGKDPIERMRRILAECPDENPPSIPDLHFISEILARTSVKEHIRASWIDFQAGEWNGATVFAAAAVEAMLFWALKDNLRLKHPEKLDTQHLKHYVEEAKRLQVIDEATATQALLANDARNLIHAGKVARTGLICNRATALTCGFNRSTQQLGEIVQPVFHSLASFWDVRSAVSPLR
jgi:hypothetical protein